MFTFLLASHAPVKLKPIWIGIRDMAIRLSHEMVGNCFLWRLIFLSLSFSDYIPSFSSVIPRYFPQQFPALLSEFFFVFLKMLFFPDFSPRSFSQFSPIITAASYAGVQRGNDCAKILNL